MKRLVATLALAAVALVAAACGAAGPQPPRPPPADPNAIRDLGQRTSSSTETSSPRRPASRSRSRSTTRRARPTTSRSTRTRPRPQKLFAEATIFAAAEGRLQRPGARRGQLLLPLRHPPGHEGHDHRRSSAADPRQPSSGLLRTPAALSADPGADSCPDRTVRRRRRLRTTAARSRRTMLEITTWPSATARSWRSTGRRSRPGAGASSGSSARTAPARRPRCAASSAWRRPDRGDVRWDGAPIDRDGAAAVRLHARAARPLPADAGRRAARLLRRAPRAVAPATPGGGRRGGSSGSASADRIEVEARGPLARQPAARPAGGRAGPRPGAAGPRRAVLGPRSDRHRHDVGGPPGTGRGRRRRHVLVAPARPRRGRVRGRRDHQPRHGRRRGRHRRAQVGRRAGATSRSRSRAPTGRGSTATASSSSSSGGATESGCWSTRRWTSRRSSSGPGEPGEVREFSFEPPALSELFMEAIERMTAPRRDEPRCAIWLVARREIIERGRSRAYVLSLLFTLAFIGAGIVVPTIIGRRRSRHARRRRHAPGRLRGGRSPRRPPISTRQTLDVKPLPGSRRRPSRAARRRHRRRSSSRPRPGPASSSPGARGRAASGDRHRDGRDASTGRAAPGGRRVAGRHAAASTPPSVTALEPFDEARSTQFLFANAGVILMFIAIFSYGYWVLTGVVEEKQSRVVEVVLSTVRPRDLLIGKVLGIGILGLVQLVAMVVVGSGRRAADGPARAAPDDPWHAGDAAPLVRPRVRALLDGLRLPRRARHRGWRRRRTRRSPVTFVATGALPRCRSSSSSRIRAGSSPGSCSFFPPSHRWSCRCGRRSARSSRGRSSCRPA